MEEQIVNLSRTDNAHLDRRFDEIMDELRKINGAFTRNDDGTIDHTGHRNCHEEMIRAARAQEEFWRELRLDVAKKGIWGILVVALGLLIVGAMVKLGIYK